MTYDWEGTRTRRLRNLKISIALTLSFVLVGLGAFGSDYYLPPLVG
jgi:hypothetical protein